jgi:Bifunctional DNA primase/polymerase, N-terminal
MSNNNIPLPTLIQYHQMGFRLVPLGDDGKIPNVSGLLNPEERQQSIEESKTGKEEPVNYIYNHPELWNEERIKKESHRFKNVATALGKTHLKRDDGGPLYINALDIDSEHVFTTLCLLSDRNGNDCYFIDEARKSTFVSKTKKKYGRHIFWLSSEQHKAIGTNRCRPGTEFEIKTDNSLALITLPPSRHRDDLETHY